MTSVRQINRVLLVGVHLEDLGDTLTLTLGRIHDLGAGFHLAGVDADEGQLAVERVRRNLECQR